MTNMKNRMIAWLLVLMILMSCFPLAVRAEESNVFSTPICVMIATPTDLDADTTELSEPSNTDVLPAFQTIHQAIDADGYAYALPNHNCMIYATDTLCESDALFRASDTNAAVLCTSYTLDSAIEVWCMIADRTVIHGYVEENSVEALALTPDQIEHLSRSVETDEIDTPSGRYMVFLVKGVLLAMNENAEPANTDESSTVIEQPVEDIPWAPPYDESENDSIPPMDESFFVDHHPDNKTTAQIGDFLAVTTDTRVYWDVEEFEELYYSPYWCGFFVSNAIVQVVDIQCDEYDRVWYRVTYLYGADRPGGGWSWTDTGLVWVLADEVQATTETVMTVTDYAFREVPTFNSDVMLMSINRLSAKGTEGVMKRCAIANRCVLLYSVCRVGTLQNPWR